MSLMIAFTSFTTFITLPKHEFWKIYNIELQFFKFLFPNTYEFKMIDH
jgi:hypothetical protein